MEKINDFISKKVVALEEGKNVGYVLDISFDEGLKKMTGLVIVDQESEEEKFLPSNKIKFFDKEYVFINNAFDYENLFDFHSSNPIGKTVFSASGENLGQVEDVCIEKYNVEKIVTNKSEISAKNISVNGDDFLIFGKINKKYKKNIENFKKNTKNSPKIKIQQLNNNFLNENTRQDENKLVAPPKIYSSTKLLLGKLATDNVFGYNNEIIIKKNEIITKNIIEKAKKHNKLTFLMFNCK